MTLPKFFITLGLVALLQSGVFAWRYSDLLYLGRSESVIANSSPETFAKNADAALARQALTRRHLETIARVAQKFNQPGFEVRALRRRLELDPKDENIALQLADALRRSGALAESEQLYRDVLRASGNEGR
jgi:thioredoxin-like negative regulator of GroEL